MPNGYELAARDPAKAALMGAIPGNSAFGDDYGFGAYGRRGISAFDPSANIGFGGQWGFGAGPLAPPPPPPQAPIAPPHPADFSHPHHRAFYPHMYGGGGGYGHPVWGHHYAQHHEVPHFGPPAGESAQAWEHSYDNPASTASRSFLLDPNRDSKVKVERYS